MENSNETYYIGLNHKNANIDVREKLAFANKEQIQSALRNFIKESFIEECVILSTCNRIEIYIYADKSIHSLEKCIEIFFKQKKQNSKKYHSYLITKEGQEVYEYLFRVASGLESMVFGENQILTQIKEAYYMAQEVNTTSYIMNKLFHSAITLGKKIRTDTDINKGAISIAYAAVELSCNILKDLKTKTVLLIGSGKTAEAVASNLHQRYCKNILVANRTKEKAVKIANKFNGKAYSLNSLKKLLLQSDLVIGSTSSTKHIIDEALVKKVMDLKKLMKEKTSLNQSKYLLMIDLAIPRDFSPKIQKIDNIFLYTIDDLQLIAQNNLMHRKLDLPKVNTIIQDFLEEFNKFKKYKDTQPFIYSLKNKLHTIAQGQLKKHENQLIQDYKVVEDILQNTINKIIKDPILFINKEMDKSIDYEHKIYLLKEAFNLNQQNTSPQHKKALGGKTSNEEFIYK